MISQRSMSRFTVRSGLINQASRIFGPRSESRPLSQLSESHNLSSDLENLSGQTPLLNKSAPRFLGNLGMKFGFPKVNDSVSPPSALSFRSRIHSSCPKEIETDQTSSSFNFTRGIFDENEGDNNNNTWIRRDNSMRNNGRDNNTDQTSRSFNFMRALLDENGRDNSNNMWNRRANSMWNNGRDNNTWNGRDNNKVWVSRSPGYNTERDADIVHVKLIRNNAFVTVTDSKGNKKIGASSGCLAEMKGGPKVSRYAAEATAEHVGRLARNMGLKSFVIKVNGFTYFKKKKQAILSFREGYTHSRSDQNPIMYIEDTTRKAHNGCRLRKQRRV